MVDSVVLTRGRIAVGFCLWQVCFVVKFNRPILWLSVKLGTSEYRRATYILRYNLDAMFERVARFCEDVCQLSTDLRLLVAVSGGPDSLSLLDILSRLGYRLVAAHFNHQLRPEADDEMRTVQRFAQNRGLPFVSQRADTIEFAQRRSLSVEEAARVLRYRFLFEQAREQAVGAVAVGHTADDQVETVIMHMLRGSGLAGLRGMLPRSLPNAWSDQVPLVRPLLCVWREEVQAYCRQQNLEPVIDRSNLDTTYFRNRLRLELIPYLQEYNPNIRRLVWQMADSLADDYETIRILVDRIWGESVVAAGDGYLCVNRSKLVECTRGVRRHFWRHAVGHVLSDLRDLDFEANERLLTFAESAGSAGSMDLIAGLQLWTEGEQLWMATASARLPQEQWPQIHAEEPLPVTVPGDLYMEGGWRLRTGWVSDDSELFNLILHNNDPFRAWLDVGGAPTVLKVRSRRPGDKIKPLGLGGHSMKISDYLINKKLPRRARQHWPLVCSGERVVWIPGYTIDEEFRVEPGSHQVILLQLERVTP